MRKAIIVGMVMIAAALSVSTLRAVTSMDQLSDGSLIKSDGYNAVYYYAGGKRYVFPNEKTFHTWYDGFDGVVTISPGLLAQIQLGGNVTYRPGVRMVKIQTDPKVYAVGAGGTLRWVKDEVTAVALYGADWNNRIDDVPEAFFVNYTVGAPIYATSEFSVSSVTASAVSIGADKAAAASQLTTAGGSSASGGGGSTATGSSGGGTTSSSASGSGSSSGSGTISGLDTTSGTGTTSGGSTGGTTTGSTSGDTASTGGTTPGSTTTPPASTVTGRIMPSDLVYRGAFRLPADPHEMGWEWSGDGLTYYPGGDTSGSADGYQGSLFGIGHAWNMNVSEVSIPAPVISATKNVSDLHTATTLQPFTDVRGGMFSSLTEIARAGMAYLPKQGSQTTDKLYFGWGQHFQEQGSAQVVPSHMWCELDLTQPDTQGAWWVGNESLYSVNDYMFDIPTGWASANAQGKLLATGRYRDGGWSGQGPQLYAIAPWEEGNPPANGARLPSMTLLEYDSSLSADALYHSDARTLNSYHHSDEWAGGAWLTAGTDSAVIFSGTKGLGTYRYEYAGPDNERGWWSDSFEGQILFYDANELAAVAAGTKQPWEPQPYAILKTDQYMFRTRVPQEKNHLGEVAFDRERGILYVLEPFGDTYRPLVHVFKVN